jgi:hypothetical protein
MSLAGLGVLLLAASAEAQPVWSPSTAPTVPPIPFAPPQGPLSPVTPEVTSGPPAKHIPPGFLDQALVFDEASGAVTQGRSHQRLSAEDLYTILGRPDLLEKSRAAGRRRMFFAVSGASVVLTGVVFGVIPRIGMPDLSGSACMQNSRTYNDCLSDANRRDIMTTTALVAGISLGGVLGALAIASSPSVLSRDETSTLVSQHNAALLRLLRSDTEGFRLAPYASGRGAGVVAAVAF